MKKLILLFSLAGTFNLGCAETKPISLSVLPQFKLQLADTSQITHKFLNLAYANSSPAQKLDIYLPNQPSATKFPVIISIHGGGFAMGDKGDGQLTPMLEGLKHGFAVVSVNYRLTSEAKFPAQINDVKQAIRFIRANANKYKLDPDHVVIWGGSAGGNLATLVATSGNDKNFITESAYVNYSDNVQLAIDWFGPIDFTQMDAQFRASGLGNADHNQINSPEAKLLGGQPSQLNAIAQQANPTSYINLTTPPILIEHGNCDNMVPVQQSVNFYQALIGQTNRPQDYQLVILDGAKHGGEQFNSATNLDLVFKFINNHLFLQQNKEN
jgi:acetyl esterase/lipase